MSIPIVQHLSDLILFLILVVGPLPLCLSLIFFLEKENQETSLPHCLLLLLTSWCVTETCIGLILGIVQCFNISSVFIVQFIVFLTGILLLMVRQRQVKLLFFSQLLRVNNRFNAFETVILGVIAFVGFFLLLEIAFKPITNYDSLFYHLPAMATWYQTSSFSILDQFKLIQISRYPYNWEVLCTLFIMPFREDFLVAFPNLIAWIILGLSIYLISINLGAKRIYSMASAFLVLTLPILIDNINTLHVDLPLASFFLVSLYFCLLYNRSRNSSYLALFTLTCGMLFGIKTSGIIYGSILIFFMVLTIVKTFFWGKQSIKLTLKLRRNCFLLGLATICCFFLLGCFWYLRNLIEVGNPLGHIRIKISDFTIFPGTLEPEKFRKTTLASLFNFANLSHWRVLIRQLNNNLSIPFFAMILQIFLVCSLLLFSSGSINTQKQIKTKHFLGIIVLILGTAFLYWTTPYSGDYGGNQWQITPWIGQGLRYAFPCMGVLGIAAALGATIVKTKDEGIVSIVLISSMLLVQSPPTKLAVALLYTAVILLLVWNFFSYISWTKFFARLPRIFNRAGQFSTIFVLVLLITTTSFIAREMRDVYRSKYYGGILEYIESNTNQGQTIGYLLSNRSYLFYGKELNRKVLYMPSDADSLTQWLDTFQKREVSLIAIGPLDIGGKDWITKREVSWLKDSEGFFVRVFGQNPIKETCLYRLKNPLNIKNL